MLQSDDTPKYQTLVQWCWTIPLKIQSLPQYDHPGALDVHPSITLPGGHLAISTFPTAQVVRKCLRSLVSFASRDLTETWKIWEVVLKLNYRHVWRH